MANCLQQFVLESQGLAHVQKGRSTIHQRMRPHPSLQLARWMLSVRFPRVLPRTLRDLLAEQQRHGSIQTWWTGKAGIVTFTLIDVTIYIKIRYRTLLPSMPLSSFQSGHTIFKPAIII